MIIIMISGAMVFAAETVRLSRAVFHVTWYDVGKAALEGLKGVQKVERGFRGFKEINTVYYNPALISIQKMEISLKRAGTYLSTLESSQRQ